MDRQLYEQRVNDLTVEMLREKISDEKRLARIEARQIVYFGNGSEGICDQRRKAIEANSRSILMVKNKVALFMGGFMVVVFLLNLLGPRIVKAIFG